MTRLLIFIIFSLLCLTATSGIEVNNQKLHELHDKWVITLVKQIFKFSTIIENPTIDLTIHPKIFEGLTEISQLIAVHLPPGENGIGKLFKIADFKLASKFSKNDRNELQITIFSEHPKFKNSTYIIKSDRILTKTTLSVNDIESLSTIKS